ncbi:MAG TPA: porin family protein, partial [Cyclobacteriaceae bacterium]|nr:porin family protein [Cyclobacteriaceae bacterium]
MKKLLLPICLLLAGVVTSNAQGVAIGLRAGLNIANESISTSGFTVSPNSLTSFVAGGYAKIMFSDKMGIQPELLYNGLGSKTDGGSSGTITTKTNYLSVPIFFRYNVVPQFHLLAGPQLGILLSATQSDNSGSGDIKDQFNSSDFGGVVG